MTSEKTNRFPNITIAGGPDSASLKIYRDGKEMRSVIEFQINGGLEQPVTAIFKELVTFDGTVELMPERKIDLSTH